MTDRHITHVVGVNGREHIEIACGDLNVFGVIKGRNLDGLHDLVVEWHRSRHEQTPREHEDDDGQ